MSKYDMHKIGTNKERRYINKQNNWEFGSIIVAVTVLSYYLSTYLIHPPQNIQSSFQENHNRGSKSKHTTIGIKLILHASVLPLSSL